METIAGASKMEVPSSFNFYYFTRVDFRFLFLDLTGGNCKFSQFCEQFNGEKLLPRLYLVVSKCDLHVNKIS